MNELTTKLIAFLAGMLSGIVLTALLYLLLVVFNIKKASRATSKYYDEIDKKEIKALIITAKEEFKDEELQAELGTFKHFYNITKRLVIDISSKFAPKSKKPYFELTIDETLLLISYVNNRLDELFKSKVLKRFRKMTIKRILDLKDMEKKIAESPAMNAAKITGADKLLKVIKLLNPVSWFKTIVMEPIVNKIILSIMLDLIEIIGVEAYNIYSKKVIQTTDELVLSEDEDKKKIEDINALYQDIAQAKGEKNEKKG